MNARRGGCGSDGYPGCSTRDWSEQKHPFHTVEAVGGVRAEECGRVMRAFFRARRKGGLRELRRPKPKYVLTRLCCSLHTVRVTYVQLVSCWT
jgi:hypothetical protein